VEEDADASAEPPGDEWEAAVEEEGAGEEPGTETGEDGGSPDADVAPEITDMAEEEGSSLTPGFVFVPAGTFTMGSPTGELGRDTDETQHAVMLTIAFEMMAREVTQGEFQALMGRNPSNASSCGSDCPVEMVNWHEALDYANALSASRGKTPCFDCTGSGTTGVACSLKTVYAKPQGCPGFRLPTEAEWEYAARARTTGAFYSGGITVADCSYDANLDAIGWYCGNAFSTTHPVGLKAANPWGLFDMSGNVYEWVWDWHGAYPGAVTDYAGPATGSNHVFRGGSICSVSEFARSASRADYYPTYRGRCLGFRLVRSL